MKHLLIVSAGVHSRAFAEAILATKEYELVGFANDAAPSLSCVWDLPVSTATADLTSCCDQYTHTAILDTVNDCLY